MGPDGNVVVHRPNYPQWIITHDRGSTMAWGAFAWLDIGPIVKVNEKNYRYLYLHILRIKWNHNLLNPCQFYSYFCKTLIANTHLSWQRFAFVKSTFPFQIGQRKVLT